MLPPTGCSSFVWKRDSQSVKQLQFGTKRLEPSTDFHFQRTEHLISAWLLLWKTRSNCAHSELLLLTPSKVRVQLFWTSKWKAPCPTSPFLLVLSKLEIFAECFCVHHSEAFLRRPDHRPPTCLWHAGPKGAPRRRGAGLHFPVRRVAVLSKRLRNVSSAVDVLGRCKLHQ